MITYLNIEKELDSVNEVIFPKPDDFLHIFVDDKEHLKKYLDFLKNQKIPNEKIIIHRLFEYYLQEYKERYNQI